MLIAIRCTNCGKTGGLPIKFSATVSDNRCKHCRHSEQKTWNYHFCNVSCHTDWLIGCDVSADGVECLDCRGTGFAFGFESNGVCDTCNGTKKIKI